MLNNKVQFAVVREDPLIEVDILRPLNPKKILLIASGGCTAFSLQSIFPKLELTLLDPNPYQIDLIKNKMVKLLLFSRSETKHLFNVEDARQDGFNECGNFESLFRGFRNFIYDLVIPEAQLRKIFYTRTGKNEVTEIMFNNKFWNVAFDIFFCDSFLSTMFGPEAVQHAPPGSYPQYFKKMMEKELGKDSAYDNYFLHHILLGHYINQKRCLPIYLNRPPENFNFKFVNGVLEAIDDLESYDFINLSNIFDWMPKNDIQSIAERLSKSMKPGAVLLFRQLNSATDYQVFFKDNFKFDNSKGEELLGKDQSFFYSKINIGKKN